MAEQSPASLNPEIKPVPQELLDQLHGANARFHQGRKHVEGEMDASEYRHQERINQAEDELRKAEREVEDVERRIQDKLNEAS